MAVDGGHLDASTIKTLGWRQGSLLPKSLVKQLCDDGLLPLKFQESLIVVVISHNCDVTNASFEIEPQVELLVGFEIENENPKYAWSKSPRRYFLNVHSDKTEKFFEFDIGHRAKIDRKLLLDNRPDTACSLTKDNTQELVTWIARRYLRSGFPDSFNMRIRGVAKNCRSKFKRDGAALSGVYLLVSDEELPESKTYSLHIAALIRLDDFEEEEVQEKAKSLLGEMKQQFENCNGISLDSCEIRSEDEFSLEDLRRWKRWDFDELSFRDGNFEDVPS
jgi:hypothetical protein